MFIVNLKINNYYLLLHIFLLLIYTIQRINCHQRKDVYIAGFFPYGDGVENGQTGIILYTAYRYC